MKAVFVELPPFERHRAGYLSNEAYRALQDLLMKHPEAGDPMPDTGGWPGCSSGFSRFTTRTKWPI